jgi:hypothetical protein
VARRLPQTLALMPSTLESLLDIIDNGKSRHLNLGRAIAEADDRKFFSLDLLAVAALNRSLSNSSAFTQLVRCRNYLVGASLVRLQLDTFLRFFAAYLVNDPHEFAKSVLSGIEIRKLKDRTGTPMTDKHPVDSVASEFPWVPSVYKATSGFIHLSNRHIHSVVNSVEKEGNFSVHIGSSPDRYSDELWIEMSEGFVAATEALLLYLEGWAKTKAQPPLVRAAKEAI